MKTEQTTLTDLLINRLETFKRNVFIFIHDDEKNFNIPVQERNLKYGWVTKCCAAVCGVKWRNDLIYDIATGFLFRLTEQEEEKLHKCELTDEDYDVKKEKARRFLEENREKIDASPNIVGDLTPYMREIKEWNIQ